MRLIGLQSHAKHNTHRYILSVIDGFSKYLHQVPVKTMSGPSMTSAFRSLFHEDDSRRPVWVRTNKGKVFLNQHFQDMLRDEGIQFQVLQKCEVGGRGTRPQYDQRKIHSYFTFRNTYRL